MPLTSLDSFGLKTPFACSTVKGFVFNLLKLKEAGFNIDRLPFSLRIVLENLLRHEDGQSVTKKDIEALIKWEGKGLVDKEISFTPGRVILQDFTGVPCVVDLATMRDAIAELGGDPKRINPLQPVELVIDHSVQVDVSGSPQALETNVSLEYQRNRERYEFLKWGQKAFNNFTVVPPGAGIVHQVNIEYLARVVMQNESGDIYPDTVFGTDSHTTMVNGLGVLGWGVGGIEAEAAMLGQPSTMLIPQVVGFKLTGRLKEGTTATDLVLTITQLLRQKGVVGKFVEFFGPGAMALSLANRATVANMAPEYGATCGYFPVDAETLRYLKLTGRTSEQISLVEDYFKCQGMFVDENTVWPEYTDTLELDLALVEPSLAGPSRPQDRVPLSYVPQSFSEKKDSLRPKGFQGTVPNVKADGPRDGDVVIAAITSCTNTSNPSVMVAAGLVAKKAVEKGLTIKPWVKTSLAPGSQVVTAYLEKSGLLPYLEKLNFHVVGYGCTTCIGNSGPLQLELVESYKKEGLVTVSVLSGNRNFEGRVHADVRANYLASPPLVVAYALAGNIDIQWDKEPVGTGKDGNPVFLKDLWPTSDEIQKAVSLIDGPLFQEKYSHITEGDAHWRAIQVPQSETYQWNRESTYIRKAPYFNGISRVPAGISDAVGARALAVFGDSITTDHISPAGAIKTESPAGSYLMEHGVAPEDFNSYGSRRGNHEVMMRGTFANTRIKNALVPGTEGGVTRFLPTGETMTIFDAAVKYKEQGIPLIVLAGKEYGSGSSRDWAAKGPMLQGVKAVIAESFERIHRSNLIGMGVVPLQFQENQTVVSLGLAGDEVFTIEGLTTLKPREKITVKAASAQGEKTFVVTCRVDTPVELEYLRHGGVLNFVLRGLLAG